MVQDLTLLHSERPKLYTVLDFLSAVELIFWINIELWSVFICSHFYVDLYILF